MNMLDYNDNMLSIRQQADILDICRSNIYYHHVLDDNSIFANLIAEIYSASDCRYGYRKIYHELIKKGEAIGKNKVLMIMQELGFEGLYPKKKCITTIANKEHKIYPYLLTNLLINKVNQVWAADITYIKIDGKFMYFIAIIDIFSRYIVEYGLSSSLEGEFYVFILGNALKKAKPEIFNTDQGSQFTSNDFINTLSCCGIKISMDHKGRCFDNIYVERLWRTVKQEAVYYYRPETVKELEKVIDNFVLWYNNDRRHQALGYERPRDVYMSK